MRVGPRQVPQPRVCIRAINHVRPPAKPDRGPSPRRAVRRRSRRPRRACAVGSAPDPLEPTASRSSSSALGSASGPGLHPAPKRHTSLGATASQSGGPLVLASASSRARQSLEHSPWQAALLAPLVPSQRAGASMKAAPQRPYVFHRVLGVPPSQRHRPSACAPPRPPISPSVRPPELAFASAPTIPQRVGVRGLGIRMPLRAREAHLQPAISSRSIAPMWSGTTVAPRTTALCSRDRDPRQSRPGRHRASAPRSRGSDPAAAVAVGALASSSARSYGPITSATAAR